MILGKSMLRAAIARGEIRLHDDHGNTLPEWREVLEAHDPQRPWDYAPGPVALQPASIDLHFGNEWLVPKPNSSCPESYVQRLTDARIPVEYDTVHTDYPDPDMGEWAYDGAYYDIPAHGFVLVRTREVIGLSEDLFGKVEGRSSVGRLGLIVETAGVVDPGFYGSITLELVNVLPNPLRVYAGMRGCQITVSQVLGSTEGGYQAKGKYHGQVKTTGTMLHRDFET